MLKFFILISGRFLGRLRNGSELIQSYVELIVFKVETFGKVLVALKLEYGC